MFLPLEGVGGVCGVSVGRCDVSVWCVCGHECTGGQLRPTEFEVG